MAYHDSKRSVSVDASGDLSADQFKFVQLDSNGQAAVASSAGGSVDGILDNDPEAQGRAATIAIPNGAELQVMAGGSTTAGGPVATNASGQAVDAASGDTELGTFVEGAGGSGEVVTILFRG